MARNNNIGDISIQSVLKGKIVLEPEYKKQELYEYNGNPFIEALPSIFEVDEVIDKFTIYPSSSENERYERSVARYHMIKRLKDFVQPLNIHFDIERKISTLLRRGYLARNPMSKEYMQRLQLLNEVKNLTIEEQHDKLVEISETLQSTASSFSIIGISGIGKTTAIERILLMYPQVIIHSEYKEKPLTRTQIVWIKIDSPYDGSLKTLCKIFFKAVDDVLGTTRYFEKFGNNRNSTATMMIHMTYVTAVHSIGILIVDEMQHLINVKNKPDEILNFFVTLVNTICVPTVFIGTFKALNVLQGDFRQARRAAAEGNIIWDRMEKDEEWDFFLETIFQYQWLKNRAELTQELNDVIYDKSQGITAVAVSLFMLAQERALDNEEEITVSLIKNVAKNDLKMIEKMIEALRNNDIGEIAKYEDIAINLNEILEKRRDDIELRGRIKAFSKQQKLLNEQKKLDVKEELLCEVNKMSIVGSIPFKHLEKIIDEIIKEKGSQCDFFELQKEAVSRIMIKVDELHKQKESKSKVIDLKKQDLRYVYKKAIKDKIHIYELLKMDGYIQNPLEEFFEVK